MIEPNRLVERALAALGPDWPRLCGLVDEWVARNRNDFEKYYGFPVGDDLAVSFELGAYLHDPADPTGVFSPYDATPRESFTFANTGSDGEHYSVLLVPEAFGAIVLTSPMAFDMPNLIVGASLRELLNLASRSGLAMVPNLAMIDTERAVELLRSEDAPPNDLLRTVASELNLETWIDIPARIAELHAAYSHYVVPTRSDED